MNSLARTLAQFSTMVADLSDLLHEIDVNPIVAAPAACIALDALVVPRKKVTTEDA
jgi:hypothetical protein